MTHKIIITKELKDRLIAAAANNSTVAQGILDELKINNQPSVIQGKANYFSSKRKVRCETELSTNSWHKLNLEISWCNRDLSNPNFPDVGDPEAMNRTENRVIGSAAKFVQLFKNLHGKYTDTEIQYFDSAIRCSKVSAKIESSLSAIESAYDGCNYSSYAQDTSTLHNSCMRYEDRAAIAADFYHNFAGAKILVVRNASDEVVGRAIIWDNVRLHGYWDQKISFIDRVYTAFDFLLPYIHQKAKEFGIQFRKKVNTYDNVARQLFVALRDTCLYKDPESELIHEGDSLGFTAYVEVPAIRWHKKGSPYLDTLSDLCKTDDDKLILTNRPQDSWEKIACLQCAAAIPARVALLCPKCGCVHGNQYSSLTDTLGAFCDTCRETITDQTLFGPVLKGHLRKYHGERVPSVLFTENGHPTQEFKKYLAVEKLFRH